MVACSKKALVRTGMPLKSVISLFAGPTTMDLKRGSVVIPDILSASKEATEKRSNGPVMLEYMQFCTASKATVYIAPPWGKDRKIHIVHYRPLFVNTDTLLYFFCPVK
jgi:hypothetical protein